MMRFGLSIGQVSELTIRDDSREIQSSPATLVSDEAGCERVIRRVRLLALVEVLPEVLLEEDCLRLVPA